MNTTEIKQAFNIKECPNPSHYIDIGRFHLTWRWAEDYWTTLTNSGFAHDDWFSIGRTRSTSGVSWNRVVIWKLCIMWSLV